MGAARLVGWGPTVSCVNSPALDREERISSHHVGAERLVGEGLTVHHVDDTRCSTNRSGISVHHVDAGLSDRGSVSSQGEGATLFLEQGQTVRGRCVVLGTGERSQIPAEEMEQPPAFHTTSRVWGASEDTGQGPRRAPRRLSTLAGRLG